MYTFDLENTFLGIAIVTIKASVIWGCMYKMSIAILYKVANQNKTNITSVETKLMSTNVTS